MSKYSQAVLAKKAEFSYLETEKPLSETYSDGSKTSFSPQIFPYAEKFVDVLMQRVKETYAALTDEQACETLCQELKEQLLQDFRFDFSDHLGPMRQRDKRGAVADVEENDYNMFHSCYKFVNQAARAKTFGEKFNFSLMSGRVNTDNQTGAEICDPFVFGPPLYLYSKIYPKVIAMTLPGFDTPEKIAAFQAHEKEMKKDMFAKKSEAAKALKEKWHFYINKKLMPEGMSFKDLTEDTVKKLSLLHRDMLTELSQKVENHFQNDVRMLKKMMQLLNKQMSYHKENGTPQSELAPIQLASLHAMQANDLLKDSSVIQVSIEAEKPIYLLMADILDDDNSLTAKIFDNPETRNLFDNEMKRIHTVKDGEGYTHILDKMENANNSKMPSFAKVLGDEYTEQMDRKQIADALRKGEAMPKVSFMLAVLLMETGAKIEGGSSQIVYARKIKESLAKVFAKAREFPEFSKEDLDVRQAVFERFNYRTAQAQIWGVKENGNVLGYRNLIDGSIKIDDALLDNVARVPSRDAFDAAAVHRFYTFVAKQPMSEEEKQVQKDRVKANLLQFSDKSDYTQILSPGSNIYNRLVDIMKHDENVQKHNTLVVMKYQQNKTMGL